MIKTNEFGKIYMIKRYSNGPDCAYNLHDGVYYDPDMIRSFKRKKCYIPKKHLKMLSKEKQVLYYKFLKDISPQINASIEAFYKSVGSNVRTTNAGHVLVNYSGYNIMIKHRGYRLAKEKLFILQREGAKLFKDAVFNNLKHGDIYRTRETSRSYLKELMSDKFYKTYGGQQHLMFLSYCAGDFMEVLHCESATNTYILRSDFFKLGAVLVDNVE